MDLEDFIINHHGFMTLKDILNVIIIPLTILAITLLWPWWQKWRKKRIFIDLIIKELDELFPERECSQNCDRWCYHLKKKFMHEAIFTELSNNRDFVLSINQKLAYNGIQMWMHFHKAEKADTPELIVYHGDRWLDYLKSFLEEIHYSDQQKLSSEWEKVINHHRQNPSKAHLHG